MRDIPSDAAKISRNDRKLAVVACADDVIIITITKNAYKELPKKLMGKKRKNRVNGKRGNPTLQDSNKT